MCQRQLTYITIYKQILNVLLRVYSASSSSAIAPAARPGESASVDEYDYEMRPLPLQRRVFLSSLDYQHQYLTMSQVAVLLDHQTL